MNCQTVKELLSEYIDNELDLKLHSEVKEHLDSCPYCQKEYEEILLIKKALSIYSQEESEPSPEFSEKLCGMFKDTYVSCDENKAKSESRLIFCLICLAICAIIVMSKMNFSYKNYINNKESSYVVVQSEEENAYPSHHRVVWRYIISGNNRR